MLGVETHTLLPIEWLPAGKVRFIDQTRLPQEEAWLETDEYREVAEAIRELRVRGAPLIGIAAAYGLALAALSIPGSDPTRFLPRLKEAAADLAATRPTAVNLTWALDRLLATAGGAADVEATRRALVGEARRIHEEDIAANHRIGSHGSALLPRSVTLLTHCNAGSLATGGYGTALGVVRSARETGKLRHVYATETRPLLQGSRLTAWELSREGIPFTLIVDSAAGSLLQRGRVGAVVVGADRITTNGDVANKIGTYSLAVLARENGVPFYVAAPTSTIDFSLASGESIPIEERSGQEVSSLRGSDLAPAGVTAANPAFDVTPHRYVTAIITENGAAREPYEQSLATLCRAGATPSA
ncbi:MAG: S-methyl-5-thioribose-1-phosphate isomerase [Dehalococcoidia bacterium]